MTAYSKINTFTRRISLPQSVAYLITLLHFILFIVCILPHLPNPSVIPLAFLYFSSFAVQICSTIITSYIDPVDSVMIAWKNEGRQITRKQMKELLYCNVCHSYVKQSSRHCKVCGRCVQRFDHHCMWINNCVGEANYYSFIAMIVSTFCTLTLFICSLVVVTAQTQWVQYLSRFIAAWIGGCIMIIFDFMVGVLVILHIILISKGVTTFQWIINRRRAQKEQESKNEEESAVVAKKKLEQEDHVSTINNVEQLQNTNQKLQENPKKNEMIFIGDAVSNMSEENHDRTREIKRPNSPTIQQDVIEDQIGEYFKRNKSWKIIGKMDIITPTQSKEIQRQHGKTDPIAYFSEKIIKNKQSRSKNKVSNVSNDHDKSQITKNSLIKVHPQPPSSSSNSQAS